MDILHKYRPYFATSRSDNEVIRYWLEEEMENNKDKSQG